MKATPAYVLPVIVAAQFAGTSLWFAGNAAAGDLQRAFHLGEGAVGDLTAAVQIGFILGTLLFALLSVADRFSPVRVFFLSSLAGAAFNLGPVMVYHWAPGSAGSLQLLVFRFLTGICLAGIYPVGMKIASDWHEKGLGKALGYLVGALVLGTAFPHLLKSLDSHLSWKMILPATSGLAFCGGLLMLLTLPDGPYRRKAPRFSWGVIPQVFRFPEFRKAAYGYFGHMWELYAWWAFVPAFLAAYPEGYGEVPLSIPLWSFAAIAMGCLGCVLGGYWSMKVGSPKVAFGMLAVSGGCCFLSPLFFSAPLPLFVIMLLVWGFAVVGDSPQFTSTVARTAPPTFVGTALTLVNCLGFSLTIASIQLLTALQHRMAPAFWFLLLLPGPVFGLFNIRRSLGALSSVVMLAMLSCFLTEAHAQIKDKTTPGELQVIGKAGTPFTSLAEPRFSWQIRSAARDIRQQAYRIRVFSEGSPLKKGRRLLWDSGKVNSDQSVLVAYAGPALYSRTRYSWTVKIWDNRGREADWSAPVLWETALGGPADWQAKWIGVPWPESPDTPSPCPNFSHTFQAKKKVARARLYSTAHGLYEAWLNGKKIGDQLFTPGWTSYHHRLQYQTYDVTELLRQGDNEVRVMLGDGWWRGYMGFGVKPKNRNVYGDQLALLFQLEITFTDGSRQTVVSGPDWKANTGAILMSDLYNGETADASIPGSTAQPVKVLDFPLDNLLPAEGPPVRVTEIRRPMAMLTTPKGELVYDFGQNLVGRVRFWVHGQSGETILLHHAEVLDSAGNFYTENLRTARQELRYTLDHSGKEQEYAPHFSFMGFRYVRVQGIMPDSLVAEVIHSDMPAAGRFSCSDSLVNRLQENIRWGQRSNFLDVPTDCPQRDERMGWTGDAQAFCRTAAFNYDVADFFQKWLKDLSTDQLPDGRVPHVIPQVMRPRDSGAAGWADAATIVPWAMFQVYGDTTFLSRQFPTMKNWVDYVARQAGDSCLWRNGTHFGDWVFYSVNDDRDGKSAITEKDFIAQAFFVHSLDLVQRSAAVLGKKEEAEFYARLMEKARKAFQEEFVTANGRLTSGTQTAYVLALAFDLLPENQRAPAASRLADNIRRYGHLTTGFLGTPLLCPVLTRFGYTDVAYRLLERKKYPSWLYPVTRGATTIWERWDGIRPDGSFQTPTMNSFNHYAYGAIGDWLYRSLAGLDADEPGYKHLLLQPHPGGSLRWAKATYETPYGQAACGWSDQDTREGRFKERVVEVEVPPNTRATVRLAKVKREDIAEGGKSLHTGNGIQAIREDGDDVIVEVGSGRYVFLSKL